jgi:hypothetical protein
MLKSRPRFNGLMRRGTAGTDAWDGTEIEAIAICRNALAHFRHKNKQNNPIFVHFDPI